MKYKQSSHSKRSALTFKKPLYLPAFDLSISPQKMSVTNPLENVKLFPLGSVRLEPFLLVLGLVFLSCPYSTVQSFDTIIKHANDLESLLLH